jgi:hypothetical protein
MAHLKDNIKHPAHTNPFFGAFPMILILKGKRSWVELKLVDSFQYSTIWELPCGEPW